MRVRLTCEWKSSQVTQIVSQDPPGPFEGVLLRARLGQNGATEARDLQDGLRPKHRLAIRLDDGRPWVSGPVRTYGVTTREINGVRTTFWQVNTEHSRYRLEVLQAESPSSKTPRRRG